MGRKGAKKKRIFGLYQGAVGLNLKDRLKRKAASLLVGASEVIGRQPVRVGDAFLDLPRIGSMQASVSEPWMTELIGKLLKERRGVFLDVGANLGQTLLKVKAIEPERNYIGFEPNPACLFYLSKLVELNTFRDVTIVPVALANKSGIVSLDLYYDDIADSSASIVEGFREKSQVKRRAFVPVFEWPAIEAALGIEGVAVVKIDVEGAELEVLQSLAALILKDRPDIIIEVLPVYSETNYQRLGRQQAIEQLVKDWNYSIYRTSKTSQDTFDGLVPLDGFGIHSDLSQCDYLLRPE